MYFALSSGGPDLKATQIYPKIFGRRVCNLHAQTMDWVACCIACMKSSNDAHLITHNLCVSCTSTQDSKTFDLNAKVKNAWFDIKNRKTKVVGILSLCQLVSHISPFNQ